MTCVCFQNARFAQRGMEYETNPRNFLRGYRNHFDHMIPSDVSRITTK